MTAATTSPAPSPFAFPAYRAFFTARLTASLAQQQMVVVIGWQVYDIARATMPIREAAFLLGMIGLAQFLPVFLLTLVVGVIADRVDRCYLARAANFIILCSAVTLAVLTLSGSTHLWPLFLIATLMGVARAFSGPALAALAPNLVPSDVLPGAIAWNSIAWQVGAIIGPAMGGILYDVVPGLPYLISTVLLTVSLTMLFQLPAVQIPKRTGASGLALVKEGLAYVRGNQIVLGAITLDLAAVILAGATAMLPIFARDILHAGPMGLGLLRAGPAIGAAAMALWLTFRPISRGVGRRMFVNVAVFSLATIVFGLSRELWLSVGALVVLGGADMISVYVRQSLIQLHTPDSMRGRVSSVSGLFISASNELGEFRAGIMAATIGAVPATVIGGAAALIVTGLWAWWFPALREADRFVVPDSLQSPEKE